MQFMNKKSPRTSSKWTLAALAAGALALVISSPVHAQATGATDVDINMPDLDGLSVLKEIRKKKATKNIPVVLLTAKGRDVDKRLGFEVGATDYIVKPFSPNRLIDRIQEILGCKKA